MSYLVLQRSRQSGTALLGLENRIDMVERTKNLP